MAPGIKRTAIARLMAALGCVSGVLGFSMGPIEHTTGPLGMEWFAAGTLLLVFAIFLLVDGAMAFQKARAS